ncbi:MAG: hypothetical protein M3R35_00265 [Candidatus Eremiobacteraeota bacterium]|nr:hypothetical protein [Candidatus Eremiobacteraeota bacterium]
MDVSAIAAGAATPPLPVSDAPVQGAASSIPHAGPVPGPHSKGTLIDSVAKLFGSPDQPHHVGLNVSYRVNHSSDEIVTVFSDPVTGKEVAQFPAEIILQVAAFFDKHSGITLDSSV